MANPPSDDHSEVSPRRRELLTAVSHWAMLGGLIAGYGTCAGHAGRYLYPAQPRRREWLYVVEAKEVQVGKTFSYVAPTGERIALARLHEKEEIDAFIALSSTCPHLGCQVHWQAHRKRFFCPCHNGVFDSAGKGTAGPPADANQSLARYPLRLERGLLFIEVPVEGLKV